MFLKGESYVFKYSFRAAEGMRVSGYSTRFGQMKGVHNGYQLSGQPMFMLAATNDGINVRFSSDPESTTEGMDEFLSWEDATGEWVHVEIVVTFGKYMEVRAFLHRSVRWTSRSDRYLISSRVSIAASARQHLTCPFSPVRWHVLRNTANTRRWICNTDVLFVCCGAER